MRWFYLFFFTTLLHAEDIRVNFPQVSMRELVKFTSRVAEVNFIGDPQLLDFEVGLLSGKPLPPEELLSLVIRMLEERNLEVTQKDGTLFITKKIVIIPPAIVIEEPPPPIKIAQKFQILKLQYHQGSEILEALQQISSEDLAPSLASMQWIRSTNSLFFSATPEAIAKIETLVSSLDTPLKQVLIEVLVLETSLQNSLDFGLEWSFNSKFKENLQLNLGEANISPTKGFDLGIIGDVIFHKGLSFVSLGSLISSLQVEGEASIVLNQKLISQENKSSRIFVGSTIPFASSMVQTIGNGQQTTANVEYRDVGVSLNITPLIGDGEMITLEISEEITEAMDHLVHKNASLSGIQTSKTNMVTSVHVPDGHFLILSGMTKTVKTKATTGPSCLGGIPLLGALFNKKEKNEEKTNLLIFVRPHIIRSTDDYKQLTRELDTNVAV